MSTTNLSDFDRQLLDGIWMTLEEMNRNLTNLLEALQPPPAVEMQVLTTPPTEDDTARAAVKELRRREGRCVGCGATRENAEDECPAVVSSSPTDYKHAWPEPPVVDGQCPGCGVIDGMRHFADCISSSGSAEETPDFDKFPRE